MKKFLCLCALVLVGLGFVACDNKKEEALKTLQDNVIETRNNIYVGADENFYAIFTSGEREEPYCLDGVINEMVPFGIISFSRNDNAKLNNEEYTFYITINGEEKTGTLEKSPFDNTYSADIGMNVDDNAEISLKISADGKDFEQTLFNENKNFAISKERAIEIASESLTEQINNLNSETEKSSEVLIKILKDYSGETNRFFWYVGVISPDGETAGVLIDSATGEVVSKKI